MAFCTSTDVIDLTGTGLETDTIDKIITRSDNRIKRSLRQQRLSTAPSPTPDDLEDASAYYSAAAVLRRHMVDGTLPEVYSFGEISGKINVTAAIKEYEADAKAAIDAYIKDQVRDFRIARLVGRDGERVGEYETMTESAENET